MLVEPILEWALTPDDEVQIAGLLARCFSTDFGGRSFFQQRHHLRLVLRWEDRIVGHVGMVFRSVRLGSELVDIAGLADVACDPDHRGKGIASTLLGKAMAEALSSQASFFLLFGTAGLYAGAGFLPAANPVTYVEMRGARTGAVKSEPAETLMVLPLRDRTWPEALPLDMLGTLF